MLSAQTYLEPPPPPRPIPDSYAWRLFWQDGVGIVAGTLLFIGAIFAFVGLALTLGVVTAFVGVPFLGLGILMAAGAAIAFSSRFGRARQKVRVLREGEAVRGSITEIWEDTSVSINNRHPWTLRYSYEVSAYPYQGTVTTLHLPGPQLQPGSPVTVLYLEDVPEQSALYPHP